MGERKAAWGQILEHGHTEMYGTVSLCDDDIFTDRQERCQGEE